MKVEDLEKKNGEARTALQEKLHFLIHRLKEEKN